MRQPAQPEHKPEQAQNTKPNRPHNPQEVVVLSKLSLLHQEKNNTANKLKPIKRMV
jgi:hypothetical protein